MVGMADGYRPGQRAPRPRQPPHRARCRQRRRRDLQRAGQQVPAADHRRPAGARADHLRGQPHQPRRRRSAPQPLREVGPRTAARRRTSRRRSRARSTTPRCRRAGPSFVSIPMDDWDERGRRGRARAALGAPRQRPRAARPGGARGPRRGAAGGAQPGAHRRPRHRRQRAAGTRPWRWPRSSACRCGRRPRPGGGRLGFPEGHPNFLGRPAAGDRPRLGQTLEGHDLVLVVGSSVFPYYPYIPGPLLPAGARARADHQRPRRGRARADGQRDRRRRRRSRWSALLELLGELRARPRRSRADPRRRAAEDANRSAARRRWPRSREVVAGGRHRRRRDALEHARAAQPPAPVAARAATTSPPAAASASGSPPRSACSSPQPERPVVCVLGEGSAQYGDHGAVERRRLPRAGHVPGAAQRGVHDPQVVRRARAGARGAPGLDLQGPRRGARRRGLRRALPRGDRARGARRGAARGDRRAGRPALVEVPVAPGMWLD